MANDLSQDLPNGPLSARSRDGYTEVPERRCSGDESITSSDRVRRLKAIPRHSDVCEETLRLQKKKQRRSISEASKASVIASLKRSRFCKNLDRDVVEALCKDLEYYAFSAGEVIVRQGEEGDHLFIVEVGLLEVSIHGRPTNDMVAGQAFGCTALLYNVPRTATVTAKEDSGLWALGGGTFRKLLRDHAERHQAQHLHLLERIHILDGLSNVQKVNVGAVALLDENFTSGHLVASEGEECRRLYLVKSGALQLVQGGEREGTHWLGGTPIKEVGTGGVFGEDYLRIDASHTLEGNLVAVGDTSLVCVLIEKLASVLGEHVELQLEKAFVGLSLRRTPWFDSFPRPRQQCIMSNQVKVISCPPGAAVRDLERVSSMPYYALVLEGSFVAGEVTLRRGQSCQSVAVERLEFFCSSSTELNRGPSLAGESIRPEELIAGPDHGRLALVPLEGVARCLCGEEDLPSDLTQHICQVLMIMRLPLLKRLADFQMSAVARALVASSNWKAGEIVFDQGELDADKFYIIVKGGVRVDRDGTLLRELRRGACFGERALLFSEPRSAKVTVTEPDTQFWSADRNVFEKYVTKNMRDDLRERAKLQDWTLSLKTLRHVRSIGVGSFGSVRMVEHVKTGARYALKRIKKVDGKVPEEVQEECKLLSAVSHPFVLQMVKSFETDKGIYILTELITGGQLYEQMRDKMGAVSRRHAQFYIGSLVLILEALHINGVAYRDLKPENVMLDSQGYLKLVDFGLAKDLMDGSKTFTVVGTVSYMAPEIFGGTGYSLEADFWSLGVLLYEMVCGRLPFGNECLEEDHIIGAIMEEELVFPPKYNDNAGKNLIERFLVKNPAERIGSNDGWAEVKDHKFFKVVKGDLFTQILSREMSPPLLPEGEEYSKEEFLSEIITLSDAEELADGELLRAQEHAKAAWEKLDVEKRGVVPSEELAMILATAEIDMTRRQIDALVEAVDTKADGITFTTFCAFLEHSELDAAAVLRALESK
ncbi:cGMP-dependent protein kinase (TgPKG) [Durusdinium trenchii]|uniref:cGMP-dependent protein kinase n=1 Tax=Durusdinium trenchii TaxID=1381693 RepID=A0ABP0MKY2_9DINO